MKIVVNEARVELVLGELVQTYQAGGYPYSRSDAMVPQHPSNLPATLRDPDTRDPLAYSMYLWCLCYYMRGGILSVVAARRLTMLYDIHPDWFVAQIASELTPEQLEPALAAVGLSYLKNQIKTAWAENARRLVERYDGDPRKIFSGVTDYDEACKRIQNDHKGGGFLGFQKKMVSMVIYYLMCEELIEPFYHPIPVDFHVTRIFVANDLVTYSDLPDGIAGPTGKLLDDLLDAIRQVVHDYAVRHQLNPIELCDAVWLLSQSLCSVYPGNASSVSPSREGRTTKIELVPVTWNQSQLTRYRRSCGMCPIEATCSWRVPSSYYYTWGQVIKTGPRIRPNLLY